MHKTHANMAKALMIQKESLLCRRKIRIVIIEDKLSRTGLNGFLDKSGGILCWFGLGVKEEKL